MAAGFFAAAAGFFAAFLNTALFMTSLVWLFGNTEYMQNSMAGRGLLAYIVAAVIMPNAETENVKSFEAHTAE